MNGVYKQVFLSPIAPLKSSVLILAQPYLPEKLCVPRRGLCRGFWFRDVSSVIDIMELGWSFLLMR